MKGMSKARRRFCQMFAGTGLLPVIGTVGASPGIDNKTVDPKFAVCFGSGALHGYTHIGAIKAFDKHGFKPDLICGTSVGAIVGVLWAAGLDADDISQIAEQENLFSLAKPGFPLFGTRKLTRLQQLLDRYIEGRDIESLPVAFAAVATDLDTGRAVTLSRGPAVQAVLASASMPLRFDPIEIGDSRMVDGALAQPVPINAARDLGATFVLGIDVAYRPYEEPVDDYNDIRFQIFHIMVNQLIEEQMKRADLAIRLDVHEIMRDTDDMSGLLEAGEQAVNKIWPQLQKALRHSSA